MAKQTFPIEMEGTDSADIATKYNAVKMLLQKLSAKELKKLADVVEKDPIKTAIAKKALGL